MVNEIKQYLLDMVSVRQPMTCFSLWFNGQKLDRFAPIGEIEGLEDGSIITMQPEAYNEAEARFHVAKVRELVGFSSEAAKALPVVDAGQSLFHTTDSVVQKLGQEKDEERKNKSDEEKEKETGLVPGKPVLDHPLAELDSFPQGKMTDLVPEKDFTRTTPALGSLQLSQWNPAPPTLRMRGHLFYLQTSILEGRTYHITATVNGFHVSNCSGERFDPQPRKISGKYYQDHSLFALLSQLSPKMSQHIEKNIAKMKDVDPLYLLSPTNAYLSVPWLAKEQEIQKLTTPDIARTQEAFANGAVRGDVASGASNLRDWNEDLQATREMPTRGEGVTIQDRVLRDKLLNKLSFDFEDAAVKGAMAIVKGDIAPLNPNEPEHAQIFMHNNIFFSFGADGIDIFGEEGGDAAARFAAGKDVSGINYVNRMDIEGLSVLATVVVDYCGRRVVCQGPVPGIFRQNQEESQIVYGSIDNREKVVNSDKFEPLMTAIADACHLKKHAAFDLSGESIVDISTPVDAKGLEGTDGRKYILDLYRLAPVDIEFIDKNCTGDKPYPHKMGTLRHEAVEDWFRTTLRAELLGDKKDDGDKTESSESSEEKTDEEKEKERAEQEEKIRELSKKYRLNPDVGFAADQVPESIRDQYIKDQKEVRDVCRHVTETLMPGLVKDLGNAIIASPIDGAQLTNLLHRRGINMRYLGALADLAEKSGEPILAEFQAVVEREIIARAAKHAVNGLVVDLPPVLIPAVLSQFVNCLFGYNTTFTVDEDLKSIYGDVIEAVAPLLTVESVRQTVLDIGFARFRKDLGPQFMDRVEKVRLFRELSFKLGIQWKAQMYNFTSDKPVVSARNIINIVPVVKASTFRSHIAEEALEAGRQTVYSGEESDKEVGKEFLLESISLHEQVYGFVHPDVARAYNHAALGMNELKEFDNARRLARKAIILAERTMGVDAPETMLFLLNLAQFEHQAGNTVGALHIIRYVMNLWSVVSGSDHPDTLTTITHVANMLQYLQDFKGSIKWYQMSLSRASALFGDESISAATVNYHLSQSLALDRNFNDAITAVRKSHKGFVTKFGEESEAAKDIKTWLDQLLQAAVQTAKMQKFSGAAVPRSANVPKATGILNSSSAPTSTSKASSAPANIGEKSVDEIMAYIEGNQPSKKKKKAKKSSQ